MQVDALHAWLHSGWPRFDYSFSPTNSTFTNDINSLYLRDTPYSQGVASATWILGGVGTLLASIILAIFTVQLFCGGWCRKKSLHKDAAANAQRQEAMMSHLTPAEKQWALHMEFHAATSKIKPASKAVSSLYGCALLYLVACGLCMLGIVSVGQGIDRGVFQLVPKLKTFTQAGAHANSALAAMNLTDSALTNVFEHLDNIRADVPPADRARVDYHIENVWAMVNMSQLTGLSAGSVVKVGADELASARSQVAYVTGPLAYVYTIAWGCAATIMLASLMPVGVCPSIHKGVLVVLSGALVAMWIATGIVMSSAIVTADFCASPSTGLLAMLSSPAPAGPGFLPSSSWYATVDYYLRCTPSSVPQASTVHAARAATLQPGEGALQADLGPDGVPGVLYASVLRSANTTGAFMADYQAGQVSGPNTGPAADAVMLALLTANVSIASSFSTVGCTSIQSKFIQPIITGWCAEVGSAGLSVMLIAQVIMCVCMTSMLIVARPLCNAHRHPGGAASRQRLRQLESSLQAAASGVTVGGPVMPRTPQSPNIGAAAQVIMLMQHMQKQQQQQQQQQTAGSRRKRKGKKKRAASDSTSESSSRSSSDSDTDDSSRSNPYIDDARVKHGSLSSFNPGMNSPPGVAGRLHKHKTHASVASHRSLGAAHGPARAAGIDPLAAVRTRSFVGSPAGARAMPSSPLFASSPSHVNGPASAASVTFSPAMHPHLMDDAVNMPGIMASVGAWPGSPLASAVTHGSPSQGYAPRSMDSPTLLPSPGSDSGSMYMSAGYSSRISARTSARYTGRSTGRSTGANSHTPGRAAPAGVPPLRLHGSTSPALAAVRGLHALPSTDSDDSDDE